MRRPRRRFSRWASSGRASSLSRSRRARRPRPSEIFGGDFSLKKPFRRAPGFYGILIVAILGGLAIDLAKIPPMKLVVITAMLNGIITPPSLAVMTLLIASERAMGAHIAPGWLSGLRRIAMLLMSMAVLALVYTAF